MKLYRFVVTFANGVKMNYQCVKENYLEAYLSAVESNVKEVGDIVTPVIE